MSHQTLRAWERGKKNSESVQKKKKLREQE